MSNLEWDNSGIRKKGVRKFFEVTQALRKEVQKSGKNEPFQRFETNNPITNTVEQKNGEYIEKIKNDYEDSKEEDPKKFNTYLMEPDIIQFSNSSELCSDPVETQPDCTHIYKTYNFKYVYDINLPVFYYREKILDVINTYPVCIIAGSTGSGKTTVIPQFIIDEHAEQQKFCNIIITQPRRVAAITTARRVSMERGWAMGTVVGYSVSLQKIISEDTRITYVTTGVLLQCLVSNPQYIKMFSHIIIDEAHERTEEIDLCLLVLRNAFKDSSSSVKLILMSATIDCKIFSEYFSNEINETLNSAPILEIVGRQYPVQLHYLDDIPLIETNNAHINKPELNEDCIKVCTNIIENLSNYDCTFHKNSSFGASLKSALVFLPGLHEILELNRTIRPYAEKHKLILLNLHSKLPPDEQLNIFFPAKQGYRKIIFATNIAESSITVPDIGYVIDFCLQKVVNWDQSTNLCHLKLSWVSKSSAEQRMGRAGRLDKGICFRLVHESIFDSFDQNNVPDMKRKPLEFVILNIKKIFKGPPILMLQLVLEPPQLTDVFRSILVLKEVGALTTTVNGIFDPNDGEVTLLGEVIRVLPLDMKLSKLIAMGYIFGLLDECAVIASCISLGCIFVSPIQKELESFMSKRAYSQGTNSDLIVYLTVYKDYHTFKNQASFSRQRKQWGRENFVNVNKLDEVCDLVNDIFLKLKKIGIEPHLNLFKKDIIRDQDTLNLLRVVIAAAFYPNYFISNNIVLATAEKSLKKNPLTMVVLPKVTNFDNPIAFNRHIHDLFSTCGPIANITLDSTRLYIEFEPLGLCKVVVPAVTNALFFRKLCSSSNKYMEIKTNLSFPINPLTLTFRSVCQETSRRRMIVNSLSVNAVYADYHNEVNDYHLLVAADVSMSSRTNQLVVGETTVYPCAKGLLELLTIIFTPFAIMRRDLHKSKYIGALCGLGYNGDTKKSLFPQNDIDIVFPFLFDNDDLKIINTIRTYISKTMGGHIDSAPICIRYIDRWKNKVIEKLFLYLNKKRNDRSPSSGITYSWALDNDLVDETKDTDTIFWPHAPTI